MMLMLFSRALAIRAAIYALLRHVFSPYSALISAFSTPHMSGATHAC